MARAGRPAQMIHWIGSGSGGAATRRSRGGGDPPPQQVEAELALLDQARDELVDARWVVEQLERARAAGDPAEQAEVLGERRACVPEHEPEVDPAGLGGHLRVGLDDAVALERGADHLLAELI